MAILKRMFSKDSAGCLTAVLMIVVVFFMQWKYTCVRVKSKGTEAEQGQLFSIQLSKRTLIQSKHIYTHYIYIYIYIYI